MQAGISTLKRVTLWGAFAAVVIAVLYTWGGKFGDAGILAVAAVAGVMIRNAIISRRKG